MAAADPNSVHMHHVLTLCGVTNQTHRTTIINEGFTSVDDFGELTNDEIDNMAKALGARKAADPGGRVLLGAMSIKKLKALAFYIKDMQRRGTAVVGTDLTAATIREVMKKMKNEPMKASSDLDNLHPGPIDPKKWKGWFASFMNYLNSLKGCTGIPLAYVCRDDEDGVEVEDDDLNEMVRLIQEAPLEGESYVEDNSRVYRIITHCAINTEAYTWVKGVQEGDGRAAVLALRGHYDGTSEVSKRVEQARHRLKQLHYKNEHQFSFERYVTGLKECFDDLKEGNEGLTEKQKIDRFLEGINTNNTELVAAKVLIRDKHYDSFINAANDLSLHIAQLFPTGGNTGKRRISSTHTQNKKNKGGANNNNKKQLVNGVDVTDPTRNFTEDEWKRLGDYRRTLWERRGKINGNKKRGGNNGNYNRSNDRPKSSNGNETPNRKVSAASSTDREQENDEKPNVDKEEKNEKGLQHGVRFGKGRYASVVATGKRVSVQAIKSNITKVNENDTIPGEEGKVECDTHADTGVAGLNCRVLDFTGEVCEVSGFTNKLNTLKSVPIANVATAYTVPGTSETVILVLNQMLWFGKDMPHTLINPNQLRCYGTKVNDDPTDNDRFFGVTVDGEVEIPFDMEGMIVYFNTRVPTDEELERCRYIILTSEESWDPQQVSMRRISNLNRQVVNPVLGQVSSCLDPVVFARSIPRLVSAKVSMIGTTERHSKVSPEHVARVFRCGLETAKRTLQLTTQRGIRHALHPLQRMYRVDHLDLNRRRLNCTFYTDTLYTKVKSLNGNNYAQVYTNGKFTVVYPMRQKSEVSRTLTQFSEDVGIPDTLVSDLATEMVGPKTAFMQEIRRLRIRYYHAEKGRHTQNARAEVEIRELKSRWRQRMVDGGIPSKLWDYGIVYVAELLSRTARGTNNRPGLEEITGSTIDISEWLDFEFYQRVWYWENRHPDMTDDGRDIGRWLGVSHRVGTAMSYWIITDAAQVISRSSVQHVTMDDLKSDAIQQRIKKYDTRLEKRLKDETHIDTGNDNLFYMIDEEDPVSDDVYQAPEVDDIPADKYFDPYINATVEIATGGRKLRGTAVKRARGQDGEPIGTAHDDPYKSTAWYEVVFQDGTEDRYPANIIAESIVSQADSEGQQHQLLADIISHKTDGHAKKLEDDIVQTKGEIVKYKPTTRGWKLLVEWKNGDSSWIPLKDLKLGFPVQVAEYAAANVLLHQPAFRWWAPQTLAKRDRIISKVKTRYWRTKQKFGIDLPKTVEHALRLDQKNGNKEWQHAIEKELKKIMVAFEFYDQHTPEQVRQSKEGTPLVGYQEIGCHFVFDVKMDLTKKARFVAGGHTTENIEGTNYSSVVSRDSIRLAFLIASLHNIDLVACDVSNAYLNAPCREKIWFKAGVEFGENAGKVVIVRRALYGLKTSGAAWRRLLADTVEDERGLAFKRTRADPDVYIRPATKEDGYMYYEMIFIYVDDILILSHQTNTIILTLQTFFELKEDSIGAPERYLGATISRYQLSDGREVWAMSARQYVREAVRCVEEMIAEEGECLRKNVSTPLPCNYRPELDVSEEADSKLANRYQHLIGVLRWAVEIGRVDILYEVSILSQHLAMPRVGHIRAAYHIFAYLKHHSNSRLVFDDADPYIEESAFIECDWTDVYGVTKEEEPPGMPEPRGRAVEVSCFVDANHAGNAVTRRSHTGLIIFVQNAPIIWFSKRQNTVESASFGSEFIALRIAKDLIVALRYKLRMFGLLLQGPANVFCDNLAVVRNSSIPSSALAKKHNAINYHAVREAVAAKVIRIGKEDGQTNIADLFTKSLAGERRRELTGLITY